MAGGRRARAARAVGRAAALGRAGVPRAPAVRLPRVTSPLRSARLSWWPGSTTPATTARGGSLPDELTIYFSSDRGGNDDVYMATRASRTDASGAAGADQRQHHQRGWVALPISSTGLDLFLESNVSGKYAVYVATRSTLMAQFSAPALVANVNIAGTDNGQPNVLPDESAIYFVSYQTASSNWDVYRAARTTGGQFGTPAQVSTINTPSDEYAPTPTSDELVLYFGSARPDSPAKGGMDVWIAKRASVTASFDPPTNVQELNTAQGEWPDWLSPDRCRLYFTRTPSAGTSSPRSIYVATRTM